MSELLGSMLKGLGGGLQDLPRLMLMLQGMQQQQGQQDWRRNMEEKQFALREMLANAKMREMGGSGGGVGGLDAMLGEYNVARPSPTTGQRGGGYPDIVSGGVEADAPSLMESLKEEKIRQEIRKLEAQTAQIGKPKTVGAKPTTRLTEPPITMGDERAYADYKDEQGGKLSLKDWMKNYPQQRKTVSGVRKWKAPPADLFGKDKQAAPTEGDRGDLTDAEWQELQMLRALDKKKKQ